VPKNRILIKPWTLPEKIKIAGEDARPLIHRGGETPEWQVVA
jgi:hypothetical protein